VSTEPLRISLELACAREHAFDTWTNRISTWWPRDHTVSGRPDAEIVLQHRVGGRIFERLPDGTEHSWGEVTSWHPPDGFGYLWHLGTDRAHATDVRISFVPVGEATTRIDIVHAGWQRLGEEADARRARNTTGWQAVIPQFEAAVRNGAQ
jgi:hypothetical protein